MVRSRIKIAKEKIARTCTLWTYYRSVKEDDCQEGMVTAHGAGYG